MVLPSVARHELQVCFRGRWFKVALGTGMVLSVLAAIEAIVTVDMRVSLDDFYLSHRSCWANWIVVNGNALAVPTVFFTALPLLASLPYSWSYCADRQSGYACQVTTRASRRGYVGSKILACFCAGSLLSAAALVLNIAVLAAFLPANVAFYEDNIILGVYSDSLFSYFFFNLPVLYVFLYTVLDAVLMGVWAALVLGLSLIFTNRVSVMVVPFMLLYAWHDLNTRLAFILNMRLPNLDIIDHLDAENFMLDSELFVIVFELCFLVCLTLILMRALTRRRWPS